MRMAAYLILVIGSLAACFCAVHYLWTFFRNPEGYYWSEIKQRQGYEKWLYGGYSLFAWIGIGVICYSGMATFLSWMPRSWVRITDDGERELLSQSFAMLAGFFGVTFLLTGMQRIADLLAKKQGMIEHLSNELENMREAKQARKPMI